MKEVYAPLLALVIASPLIIFCIALEMGWFSRLGEKIGRSWLMRKLERFGEWCFTRTYTRHHGSGYMGGQFDYTESCTNIWNVIRTLLFFAFIIGVVIFAWPVILFWAIIYGLFKLCGMD